MIGVRRIIVAKRAIALIGIAFTLQVSGQERGIVVTNDATSQPVNFGQYSAIVIGIDAYDSSEWPDLNYAEKDARDVAQILRRDYGFHRVTEILGRQATRSFIINRLSTVVQTIGANDNLFVFYAGHGQLNPFTEEGFWVPVDGLGRDESSWISFGRIRKLIEASNAPAKRIALVTDSCYGGALTRRSGAQGGLTTPELAGADIYAQKLLNDARKKSRLIIASGGFEQVPDRSEFAALFKQGLRDNTLPVADLSYLFSKYVTSSLSLRGLQDPVSERLLYGGDWDGQFVLVRQGTSRVVATNPTPTDSRGRGAIRCPVASSPAQLTASMGQNGVPIGSSCFYLAQGHESCSAACSRLVPGSSCDLQGLQLAATSVQQCRAVVSALGGSGGLDHSRWGQYPDNNSGCTYGDWGQGGDRWVQVMLRGHGGPTCDAVDGDYSRMRVCACK